MNTLDSTTTRADRFGQRLLLVNGGILSVIALFAFLSDLAGAFFNVGGFASILYQNDAAIGMVEAHGLAFIAALLLIVNRGFDGPRFNFAAVAMHLLLGSSNLLFWPLYGAHDLLTIGILTTVMHGLFFVLELGTALWRKRVTGPAVPIRNAPRAP